MGFSKNFIGSPGGETYLQGRRVLQPVLARKSEVHFRKKSGGLLKKQYVFQYIILGAESALAALNDALKIFTGLF